VILLLVALAFVQSDVQQGAIAGVVMKSNSVLEQMLPNARLELSEGPGTPLIARTGAGGRFLFPNLPAGRYRLSVTKDGFIRKQYGPIDLQNRQQIGDIVFRLDQAPVASGWVQDAEGEPLAGVSVQALRRSYDARGNRSLTVVASAVTDDRGEYRIFWLDPGEYFFFSANTETTAVVPTYYPGVTDADGAKLLRLDIGRELTGLNFRLGRGALWPVSGYITDAVTGRPTVASIDLIPSLENPNPARYQAQSNPQGTFAISKPIPPGSYIAMGRTNSGELFRAFARISLRALLGIPRCACPLGSGYDLRLALNPEVVVNGKFFTETNSPVDLRRTRVSLAPSDAEFPAPAPVSAQADGQFSVAGVTPGTYHISISELPGDVYVKAARVGRIDVLEEPLTIMGQAKPEPLQVQLGLDGGRITVGVVNRQNRPFGDASVVLVPDAARRHRPDQYRLATTDETGIATMRGIPPGDYKLFAWELLEPNAHLNVEYLRPFEGFGVPVRVSPGENAGLTIRAIPSE
jgi:hypothetical protein